MQTTKVKTVDKDQLLKYVGNEMTLIGLYKKPAMLLVDYVH